MSDNALTSVGTTSTVPATGDLFDQYKLALSGDIVSRNASGTPEASAGSLGSETYPHDKLYLTGGFVFGGTDLDLSPLQSRPYAILSGASKTSGYPQFLATLTNTTTCVITPTTPLSLIINNNALTVSSTITYSGLGTAINTNATCLVNDTTLPTYDFTKTIGEFGREYFVVDNIGTSVTSVNGTIQPFKVGATEYAVGYIDTTNSKIYPIQRGIGGSDRIALTDNATITLLKAEYLFLAASGPTTYKTINAPIYASSDPASAVSGDFYYNPSSMTWKRYSGAAWVAIEAIYLGMAIQDSAMNIAIEPDDFFLNWRDDGFYSVQYLGVDAVSVKIMNLNVAGTQLKQQDIPQEIINLSDSADRESGVSEAASTRYFVYIKPDGKAVFSDKYPRQKNFRKGFYHPYEYWRAIACVYNGSGSDIRSFSKITNDSDLLNEQDHLVLQMASDLVVDQNVDYFTDDTVPSRKVSFDTELIRRGGFSSSFSSAINAPRDGVYEIKASLPVYRSSAANPYDWYYSIDSPVGTIVVNRRKSEPAGGGYVSLEMSETIRLSQGQAIRLRLQMNSSSTTDGDLFGGLSGSRISIRRIGD